MRHIPVFLLLFLSSVILPACEGGSGPRNPLKVFVAGSLAEVFDQIEIDFEKEHPDCDVVTLCQGSQSLRLQIEQGAAMDVVVLANEAHMEALFQGGFVEPPRRFAGNRLALIVPEENPAGIQSLADLDKATGLILGGKTVPVGIYADKLIERLGRRYGNEFKERVLSAVVSREHNTRLVRGKIQLGAGDAAIVFHTDALHTKNVKTIQVPDELNVEGVYMMGKSSKATEHDIINDWISFLVSAKGQDILVEHGFVR